MKVDKGVCTSNDAYFAGNTAPNELNSIIKFETVFTTLVENKILAIKRECEQHESKKKARTLKGVLLRKANNEEAPNDTADDEGQKKKKRKNFFAKYYQKPKEVDVESGERKGDELVNVVIVQNDNKTDDREQGLEARAHLDSQPNAVEVVVDDEATLSTKLKATAAEYEKQNCDKLIIDSRETAQVTLSTPNNSSNVAQSRRPENDESSATTADISLPQSSAIAKAEHVPTAIVPINNNHSNINVSNKSDVAIYDDGASSQNTSDIEFSLASEASISELPPNAKSDRKSANANSDPVSKKSVNVLSPPLSTRDKKIERKAISCQSTPLFGRHRRSESEGKKVLTFQKELPKGISKACEKDTTIKSQTIVTTTSTLARPTTTTVTAIASHLPLETVHSGSNKKGQRHSKKLRDVSLEYEITYDGEENQSPHGFISSFNQLTAQKPPAAVICANLKKPPVIKDQPVEGEPKAQQEVGGENTKAIKSQDIELELDELAVDVGSGKKKKRRSKFRAFVLYN